MVDGLKILGADVEGTPDGAIIRKSQLKGGVVQSHDDHRIAMAFSIASLRASENIEIRECNNVATSFPNFVELAQELGLNIRKEDV